MRQIERMAGATLIFSDGTPPPQPVGALQFLLDDIRAGALGPKAAQGIRGLRMSGDHIRLRAGDYDLAVAFTGAALPLQAFSGAVRPFRSERADLQRGRIVHLLRTHRHALGLLLRVRLPIDPAQPSPADGLLALALPLCAGLKPRLVMIQGSGLLLTLEELSSLRARTLAPAPDQTTPLALAPRPANRHRLKLGEGAQISAPVPPPQAPLPHPSGPARDARFAGLSLGRLFGMHRQASGGALIQNLPASELRLARAMRRGRGVPAPINRPWRAAGEAVLLALWFVLVLPPTPL